MEQDKQIFAYFRRHFLNLFPALAQTHGTTFARQGANLWKVKARLWQSLLAQTPHDPNFQIVDSFPLSVCRFARAPRCQRFRGQAAFGQDLVAPQTFFGFRIHTRLVWPGLIATLSVAAGNQQELEVLPDLVRGATGTVLGNRNYWSPKQSALLAQQGLGLQAPYRSKKRDPHPATSRLMSRLRYRIGTVIGQWCERYQVKRVWARDAWHLMSRLLRMVLSHTLMVQINQRQGNPPLQLDLLLTC